MAKSYKEMRVCRMCKKRFDSRDKVEGAPYSSKFYCPECTKKYFKKEKE